MYLQILLVITFTLVEKNYCLSNISDAEYNLMPNLFQFEDYNRCLSHDGQPQYCLISVKLNQNRSKNFTEIWDIIKKVSSNPDNYKHDLLRNGVCIQDLCPNGTAEECLSHSYTHKYDHLGLTSKITEIRCESKNSSYPLEPACIIFGSFLGVYVVFVITVSFCLEIFRYKFGKNYSQSKSKIRRFFSIFSIFENWRNLMILDPKQQRDDFMPFLQGIRFGTTVGVIITHAVEINAVLPVQNPRYIEKVPTRFIAMVLANGGNLVQVYFVVSSWLLTLSFFEKLKNFDKINFFYVLRSIVSRYIRLTPVYALIIALHGTWLVHLRRGPFWDAIMGEDYRVCRKNWWHNLLYFNNFVINDGLCMFHSWYLSADLQFYILGLLILWMTQKRPKLILLASGCLILCHMLATFFTLIWHNWEIAVKLRPELLYHFGIIYSQEWQATWTATYSDLPGLAAGLCFGYLHFVCRDDPPFTKKQNRILWWIFSWSLFAGPILFSSYYMTTDYYSNSRWFAAIYGSLCKVLYALGVGSIIFGMSQGLGGFVKIAFEWAPMHVLAQLSFCAYLVHFTILKVNAAMRILPVHVTDYLMVNEIVTNTAVSFLISGVLTLLFQMPSTALSKLLV